MDSKAAVIGDSDFVMAFGALGLDAFAVEANRQGVVESAEKILADKYGLVVVAENIAAYANEVFEKKQKDAVPCVVVVPFLRESEGFATKALGKVLKAATGIDIIN